MCIVSPSRSDSDYHNCLQPTIKPNFIQLQGNISSELLLVKTITQSLHTHARMGKLPYEACLCWLFGHIKK